MSKLFSLFAAVVMAASLSIAPASASTSNQLLNEDILQADCSKKVGIEKKECLIRLLGSHQ